jgi:autotransporter translocation and assembly factor TamB
MSRPIRLIRNIAIGLGALVVVSVVATIIIVQTDWFRNYVRHKIIVSTEEGTGGTVDVGSFRFDWKHLRAVVTDFVIHGNEPAGTAPFVQAARVQVDIRLFTSIHHLLDVHYLRVERPETNVIVFPDGRTNVPTPKQKSNTNQTALENVIQLAVDHFELINGKLGFESQKQELNIRGSNLRAELWYNVLKQGYQGQINFEPMYVVSGRNTPVTVSVKLPVAMQSDRIDFKDATITTAQTSLVVNGSVENMRNPKVSAHVNGHVALVDLKNAGNVDLALHARDVPSSVDLDANATIANDTIQVSGLRLGIGHSEIEASGTLKDSSGRGSLEFKSRLVLGELGRLAKVSSRPEGTVVLNGTAALDASNNYRVDGNILAKGLSFQEGSQRISNINLFSAIHVDPHLTKLDGLRLAAFGGEFHGDAALEDFARYRLRGNLRGVNLRNAAHALGEKQFAYDGSLSGPIDAAGNLQAEPITKGVTARLKLSIAPGRQGIPVSGRLFADYNGAADRLNVQNSYIALPHTRLTMNGSLGGQLNVALTTSDVSDLLAATGSNGKSPIKLNDRQASFTGVVTGSLESPRIAGHFAASGFSIEDRLFDSLAADLAASKTGASVRNGSLRRGAMDTEFSAQVGLTNWKPAPNQPLAVDATVRNGDLADMFVLAGQPSADYSGALSATLHIGGTMGNPTGAVNVVAMDGMLVGERFDRMQAQINLTDQLVTIPGASLEAGSARVNLTGEFRHPRDSFTTGQVHAHVQSNQIDLAQLRKLQQERPNTTGMLQVNADVSGHLSEVKESGKERTEFLLTSVNGDASARALRFEGQDYGNFQASARTNGQNVSYNVTSDFAGSSLRVNGSTQLTRGYPTNADATIANLPVERVLQVAKRTDIHAQGNLSGKAHFAGTVEKPEGNADLDLANAVLYDEPIDHVRLRATYLARSLDVSQLEVVAGPSRIDMTARFDHPEGDLQKGNVQFRVNSSRLDLARIKNVQNRRPGLGGTVQMSANGSAELVPEDPRIRLHDLDANVAANHVLAQGKNYGDLTLIANTSGGKLTFNLDSNLANASIHGRGNAQLIDSYPVDAQLTFSNVAWTRLQGLIGQSSAQAPSFEILADGQASVRGPVLKADELNGSVQLTRLNISSIPGSNRNAKVVTLQNQGPVTATLDKRTVRIDNAHIVGPQTDIQARGTVGLQAQTLDLTVNANADLGILQSFSRDINSSGTMVLASTVRGTFSEPLVNGQLELRNGSLNYLEFPNGIANANGVVVFNGDSASIRNMTAESGGGKITMTGFMRFRDNMRFGLRADASGVRVRPQSGFSVVADGDLRLTGTGDSSVLSGTATIQRITYAPQTDMGSLLTRAAPPVQSPTAPSPILENMRVDIRIRTSNSLAVQTSLAESLEAQADLRIRGTMAQPGVLGRVTITEGKLAFFGTTYEVNSGTIGFYNPIRIEPVLDVTLTTKAKGVDVTLRVTGPIDNMKLSYTSDPPLQFQEIVSLLASGKTPTSDPTLLANQPSPPPQSFQQMGESALVSKAIADPMANRLQRVFGVSQLKIDPTFTSGSELPQAQLTLQQQVANNLTFTYVTALNNPNAQTIRVEWTFNPQWSALATRDQNGIFSVNFLYKRQLR